VDKGEKPGAPTDDRQIKKRGASVGEVGGTRQTSSNSNCTAARTKIKREKSRKAYTVKEENEKKRNEMV